MSESQKLDPGQEAESLLQLHEGRLLSALDHLERQLNVVQTRAQVLVSLAGVVVTVTGFSGRIIAATGTHGKILIISGLFTVLLSAIYVTVNVMKIQWISQVPVTNPRDTLITVIHRRNRKTSAYRIGGFILLIGLALYCIAISFMLGKP